MLAPHPLISVADVPASSRFYQQILGADSGHGGDEYERVLGDGDLGLQLRALTAVRSVPRRSGWATAWRCGSPPRGSIRRWRGCATAAPRSSPTSMSTRT